MLDAEHGEMRQRNGAFVDVGRPHARLGTGECDCDRDRTAAGADVRDPCWTADPRRCLGRQSLARHPRCHHLARRGHKHESVERDLCHTSLVSRPSPFLRLVRQNAAA